MRLRPLPVAALLLAVPLRAHPGVGIVLDAEGNLFYTDLKQVWRIAPDGTRSLAVADVHSHELCLDGAGHLYGEHLWYEGERRNRWGHRVWRRSPDGRIETVLPPTEGFLQDYSFVRDAAGTHYWLDREGGRIRKRLADGRVLDHARIALRDGRWMTAAADGTLFLVDATDLLRVDPQGQVAILVKDLQQPRLTNFYRYDRHALMGLWLDRSGNVYVAGFADREVKRVDPLGRVSVAARTAPGWGPTGGLFAPDGALWILEGSVTGAVRVRRIAPGGAVRAWPRPGEGVRRSERNEVER